MRRQSADQKKVKEIWLSLFGICSGCCLILNIIAASFITMLFSLLSFYVVLFMSRNLNDIAVEKRELLYPRAYYVAFAGCVSPMLFSFNYRIQVKSIDTQHLGRSVLVWVCVWLILSVGLLIRRKKTVCKNKVWILVVLLLNFWILSASFWSLNVLLDLHAVKQEAVVIDYDTVERSFGQTIPIQRRDGTRGKTRQPLCIFPRETGDHIWIKDGSGAFGISYQNFYGDGL